MKEMTAAGQPTEYLESLLDRLACPLDNSVSLSAVRDAEGEIVALRSRDTEYRVVRNVPCLVPELGKGAGRDLPLWQGHQKKMWQEYQDGEEGVFTPEDDTMGRDVGEIIARSGGGVYLDVGCGALAWPVYMAASSEQVEWIGIDPFFGDVARRFPFVQGLGEYLPFLPGVFDGALYASTVYQLLDPKRSLNRLGSILKPEGKLFVWYTACRVGPRYYLWRGLRALGLARRYSDNYLWAFTPKSLHTLLAGTGFAVEDEVFLCETCSDFPTCDHPSEYLTIAHRV